MIRHRWVQEFPGAVIVCDAEGKILEMNATAVKNFQKDGGGKKLIYQAPWSEAGRYRGVVELSLEIPSELPHFTRDS